MFYVSATKVSAISASGRSYGIGVLPTDKDSIVYPDQIIRDSYGNVAKPYVPLEEKTENGNQQQIIGVHTDINKDQQNSKPDKTHPYVLPSYAGGILNANVPPPPRDLSPPHLSSGNYNFPAIPLIPSVSYATDSPIKPGLPKDNTYQNEIVPRPKPTPYSQNTNSISRDSINQHDSSYSLIPQNPQTKPSDSSNRPNTAFQHIPSVGTADLTEYEKTYTHGTYHGGFGGAAGVLGEQQEIGYAVNGNKDVEAKPHTVQDGSPSLPQNGNSYNSPPNTKPIDTPPSHNQYGSSASNQAKPLNSYPNVNAPVKNTAVHTNAGTSNPGYNPQTNGHIGPNPVQSHVPKVPEINLDLVAPHYNSPSTGSEVEISYPESSHDGAIPKQPTPSYGKPNEGTFTKPIVHSPPSGVANGAYPTAGTQPIQHNDQPTTNYNKPIPGTITPGHSPPASVNGAYPTAGKQPTRHNDQTTTSYNKPNPGNPSPGFANGAYPTAGTQPVRQTDQQVLDAILGLQKNPGFAVTGLANNNHSPQAPPTKPFNSGGSSLDAILGNQQQPGFAVTGSGSPSHNNYQPTIAATTTKPASYGSSSSSGTNNDRYTGGFGGPPGQLSPYDNSSKPVSTPAASTSNSYSGKSNYCICSEFCNHLLFFLPTIIRSKSTILEAKTGLNYMYYCHYVLFCLVIIKEKLYNLYF